MDQNTYDSDYYLRGRESGKSLYEDYRWLPELTVPMVQAIDEHLDLSKRDVILDYGCARGYTVKAFREALGIECYGVDISEWAIANADESTKPYLSCTDKIPPGMDWIIAKDVLEHVPNVADVITEMMESAKQGLFAVVPLSMIDGNPYVVESYEHDVTHIHRLCLSSWARMFMRPGWSVTGSYMVRGVKGNYAAFEWGNGFITAKRI
jgi:2-polyprenyl-3-methyl-5-hydroxy-6-metoxy-1,4-benzoquinol methylase